MGDCEPIELDEFIELASESFSAFGDSIFS